MLRASESSNLDVSRFMSLWKDFKANVLEGEETEDEIKSAFRDYDINGDGYITKDEMISASAIFLMQWHFSTKNLVSIFWCVRLLPAKPSNMISPKGPSFHVKLHHGQTTAFKKVLKIFNVEFSSCQQINNQEFLVTFEEPTTTIIDAKEFCPAASWPPA